LSEGVGYSTSLRMALCPPAFACRGRAYAIGSHAAMAAGAPRGARVDGQWQAIQRDEQYPFVPAKAGTQLFLDSRFRGNERKDLL
jgi:hypothetical protein